MVRKLSLFASLASVFWPESNFGTAQASPDIHVVVNMVQLNVAVTDKKGNYVTGTQPSDFAIDEDGSCEKPATFAEGMNRCAILVSYSPNPLCLEWVGRALGRRPSRLRDLVSGANVLFCSIPATTCTADSSLRRTRSATSCDRLEPPTRSRFTRTAGISPGLPG